MGKDAYNNHGDAIAGWFKRLYPEAPEAHCDPRSYQLDIVVTDYLSSNVRPACAENTGKKEVVTVKLVNTHYYPVLITLPKGVTVAPHVLQGDGNGFEEVMSQLLAQYRHSDRFLLRGGHLVDLDVDLAELQPEARITTHVDAGLLLTDMGLWIIDMGMDQQGAGWKALKKLKKAHGDLDHLTACFTTIAKRWQDDPPTLKRLQGKDGQKAAARLIQDALDKGAEPVGKAVHGFWNELWNDTKKVASAAKGAAETVVPVGRMIKQFKVLWDNPGVITEWTEGLIAGLTPDNAGRVVIELRKSVGPAQRSVPTVLLRMTRAMDATRSYLTRLRADQSGRRIPVRSRVPAPGAVLSEYGEHHNWREGRVLHRSIFHTHGYCQEGDRPNLRRLRACRSNAER